MPAADPRHTVTPDAFHIDPALLGTPLATPKRRLAAILLDLLLAAIIGQVGGMLIGLVVAVVFFRYATRRVEGSPMRRWGRSALALAGALVLFVTAVAVLESRDDEPSAAERAALLAGGDAAAEDGALGGAVYGGFGADLDEAEQAEVDAVLGNAFVPDDVRAAVRTALADETEAEPLADTLAAAELLRRYADALAAADTAALDTLGAAAEVAAGPQLARLRARNDRLAERIDAQDEAVEALEEAAANPGLGRLLRATLSDFGLTIGWVGLYFTLFLAYWDGRTPAKRLFGLRTVRLDGRPITLWNAFERFGGLAAGVATGLIGFAQVYWDPNRQTIHDKIASTVVVRVGATEEA